MQSLFICASFIFCYIFHAQMWSVLEILKRQKAKLLIYQCQRDDNTSSYPLFIGKKRMSEVLAVVAFVFATALSF